MKSIFKITILCCLFCGTLHIAAAQSATDYDKYMDAARKSLSMGDFPMVKLICADAMILDVTRPEGYLYTAMALYSEGDLDMAEDFVNQGLIWCDEEKKKIAENILVTIGDKRQFNKYIEQASYEHDAGNTARAATFYDQAWQLFPIRTDVGFQTVDLYLDTQNYPRAMEILEELINYPDPTVEKIARKLYATLDGTSMIKDKKAFEKSLADGDKYADWGDYDRAVSAYKTALQYKPGNSAIQRKLAYAKEEVAYENAMDSKYVSDSEKYADQYPSGRHITEINNLIKRSYKSIAKGYYEERNESKLIDYYNKYIERFPYDADHQEIRDLVSALYYEEGERNLKANNWSNARHNYKAYLSVAPSGEHADYSERKIKKCDRRLKQRSTGYLLYAYDEESPIGLTFGRLNKNKLGHYITIKMNTDIFSGLDVLYKVDESGDHDSPNDVLEATGEEKLANISLSGGVTFKLVYPLYAYMGGGAGYYPVYEEYNTYIIRYNGSRSDGETEYFRNSDRTEFRYFPEAGVMLKIGNALVLKYGARYDQEMFLQQFGLGFQL
ncbi:tetratricopeptide repeat protein [Roseivirga sp. BDSF3-8]|uniref:tetratricopeptide repeat protein n=1 Tax=Roseivirga sp. BDSF3-8 TaxID=3241598 RepID=UPI00353238B9